MGRVIQCDFSEKARGSIIDSETIGRLKQNSPQLFDDREVAQILEDTEKKINDLVAKMRNTQEDREAEELRKIGGNIDALSYGMLMHKEIEEGEPIHKFTVDDSLDMMNKTQRAMIDDILNAIESYYAQTGIMPKTIVLPSGTTLCKIQREMEDRMREAILGVDLAKDEDRTAMFNPYSGRIVCIGTARHVEKPSLLKELAQKINAGEITFPTVNDTFGNMLEEFQGYEKYIEQDNEMIEKMASMTNRASRRGHYYDKPNYMKADVCPRGGKTIKKKQHRR